MNRLYVAVGALLVILLLSFTSCSLYKSSVATSVKADIAQKALTGAVVESKAEVRAEYRVQQKKAVVLDSVRTQGLLLRKEMHAAPELHGAVRRADDPEFIRMFNDAVRANNRAIESSSDLP